MIHYNMGLSASASITKADRVIRACADVPAT